LGLLLGKIYPKGTNKSDGPQLILSINREVLFAGFILGDYASDAKNLYAENIITNKNRIIELLGDIFSEKFYNRKQLLI
jgi:hypothetical protein